jgi:hypothetical protein
MPDEQSAACRANTAVDGLRNSHIGYTQLIELGTTIKGRRLLTPAGDPLPQLDLVLQPAWNRNTCHAR